MKKNILFLTTGLLLGCQGQSQKADTPSGEETPYTVSKSDTEWKESLSELEYYVLRKAGTERPGTSDLLKNKQKGTYVCAGCGHPVFRSEHKFDSGTGWPSFDREIEGNVAYSVDYEIGYKRTEEHCARCGGHLGHVFDDGPRETTGMRHCINGAALNFVPEN